MIKINQQLFFPIYKLGVFVMVFITIVQGCNNDPGKEVIPEEPETTLSASPASFSFAANGGTADLSITSNSAWRINFETTDWCKPSIQASSGNALVTLTAQANAVEEERMMHLTLTADGATDVTIQITQAAKEPEPIDPGVADYIAPDNTGMDSDALTIASKIFMGWNLGNTLEATGGETAWGNAKTTNDFIVAVKDEGFNAIRIPCSWDQYLEDQTTYKIKDTWLARVKEVVDYCVDNDMYAILNIHWDGGWLENNVTTDKQDEVDAKQAAIWKQIAKYFRDYDEHLLFAGANEPNVETEEQANVLNVYMQTFVDVVRATGGRNTYRNLIIPGPSTDIDKTDQMGGMPTDPTDNRLMAEVHYYTPWNFCGLTEDASWGKMFYFWGAGNHVTDAGDRNASWGEEATLDELFLKMKTKFVDNGIPVILGEFSATRRDLGNYGTTWQEKHDDSRAWFAEYVTRQAKNNGMVPFYWDNGPTDANSCGIFDRSTGAVGDQKVLDGLVRGAQEGAYPF